MASNPMQRKSRNSFLFGMITSLLITGAVIIILILQLKEMKEQQKQEQAQLVNIYVLNQDVKSGQVLTEDMFVQKLVNRATVPSDATSLPSVIETWFLQTKDGKKINTDKYGLYLKEDIENNNGIIEVLQNESSAFEDSEGETIEFNEYFTYINGKVKKVTTKESNLKQDGYGAYFIDEDDEDLKTRVWQEDATGEYYIYVIDESTMNAGANKTRRKEYLTVKNTPIIAKIAMNANTVITPNYVVQNDEVLTDDVRKQEYNMVVLPIDLMTDDYVDIRLMTPNGQDFIVISKAKVDVPQNEDGTYVSDTIRMNLREDEILAMSSAIVEAYGLEGSKLYATKYPEPALQNASMPTYTPNASVTSQIQSNPNIVDIAKEELASRYSESSKNSRNNYLQSLINSSENYMGNIEQKTDEDITEANSARKKYLESLGY